MKKTIIAVAAVAAAFTMASCIKELPVSPNEGTDVDKCLLSASIDSDLTKTTLDGDDTAGYAVLWKEGDKLFVTDSDFEKWAAAFTLDKSSALSSRGTFVWQTKDMFLPVDTSFSKPVFEKDINYTALYPFDLVDMDASAYIWKTKQTYSTSDFYIPMFAETECTTDEEAGFHFLNLGGLLRLTVKGSAEIVSITVQAREPMSGEIAAIIYDENDAKAVMLDETEDGELDAKHYIALDCKDGVELSSEGTDFYISIPCHYIIKEDGIELGGYSDVTITLTDKKGDICVKRLSGKTLRIERSRITTASFTASEFKQSQSWPPTTETTEGNENW